MGLWISLRNLENSYTFQYLSEKKFMNDNECK